VNDIREAGGQSVSMVMDTSKPDDDKALVGLALSEYGRLDILVNNAAIDAPSGNVWDLPDEDWERTIGVNLSGVFYCSRAALVPMLKASSGAIVNMSSVSARFAAKGMSPAYNASKAGVLGLTAAPSR
jgi:3-oxoacyl-[acyl-carrier protein] reductase